MRPSFKSTVKSRTPFQSERTKSYSEEKAKKPEAIIFMVVDDDYMGMHLPYALSNDTIKSFLKQNGGSWSHNFKIWKIPKSSYTLIRTQIPRRIPSVSIEDLPLFIDRALKNMSQKLHINGQNKIIAYEPMDRVIKIQDNFLYEKLYSYQKYTLTLAVRNYGRLLIGDEMGIGKSIQGLACALLYQNEWPLLIICPSALKSVWRDEIKKWLHQKVKKEQIFTIDKPGQQFEAKVHKIVITSYEIAVKCLEKLEDFKIAIVDQAHYLKNTTAKRTENLVPYLQARKRIFLLSGTPALSKPRELYPLIQIIRPDIFYSIKEFGDRYCYMKKNQWNYKLEYDGARNSAELYYILKNRIMIRRCKDEVLSELPSKQRQFILIESNKSQVKKIKQLMSSKQIPLDILRNSERLIECIKRQNSDDVSPLPKSYMLTGLAKIDGIKNYLTSLFENQVKILIFAHHIEVLNQISDHLSKMKVEFIRIDGSTGMETRKKHVRSFQDNFNIKAAVLSIMAANVGITLTAASTVIFAEMHWTPSQLLQAEDRAHRIGQKSCVNVHYLIGENTLDHLLLRQLERKLVTTGEILNGTKEILEGENIQKGYLGKLESTLLTERKRRPESSLLDFISIKQTKKGSEQKQEMQMRKQDGGFSSEDIDEEEIDEEELERIIEMKQREFELKVKK